jgi:hypothetical protein
MIVRQGKVIICNQKETIVDREVHATAGQEASATVSCAPGDGNYLQPKKKKMRFHRL